jgi:hypothetical protein
LLLSFQLKRTVEFFYSASVFFFLFLGQKFGKRWHNSFKGNIFSQILWFFKKKHLPNWQKIGFCLGGCCQNHAIYELSGKEKSHQVSRNLPRDACHSVSVRELRKKKLCSAVWSHIQSFFFFFWWWNFAIWGILFFKLLIINYFTLATIHFFLGFRIIKFRNFLWPEW